MADRYQVITQIAETRLAAQDSSDAHNDVLAAEGAKPAPDRAVMTTCTETIAKNGVTIRQCDKDLVAAVLAQADADGWLAQLRAKTAQMKAQSAALTADVAALNQAKAVATEIAGVLSLLGV